MIKSGILIERIVQDLNAFRQEIESNSKLGLLNQNIHAENFIKEVLNITYDLNLKSLNSDNVNFPGLDLGDDINQSVAFQVTSRSDLKKINDTLSTCIDNGHYKKYNKIKFFILSKKQRSYTKILDTSPYFEFNPQKNILDFDDLFISIKRLELQKLEEIYNLVSDELLSSFYQDLNPTDNINITETDYPELILDVNYSFKINLGDKELEVLLMELEHFFELNQEGEIFINIKQENYFFSRLNELKSGSKSVSERREIIEIRDILHQFSKLKREIQSKLRIFYHTEKFPISKNYTQLVFAIREIVEKLSFPSYLIYETVYSNYYQLDLPDRAKKNQGDIKFDVYKTRKDGKQLGCGVWLTKKEVIEIKNRTEYFKNIDNEHFFKNSNGLMFFSFNSMNFNVEILSLKVIPSFIDSIYCFKNEPYNFLDKDDYNTWTDLTNYEVGLG
mgnify:CR=1 FL=1